MLEVSGIEKITECFNRMNLVGITYYTKNFVPEMIVYLFIKSKNRKIQIETKSYGPNNAILTVKEVKKFTIPVTTDDSVFYIPKTDDGLRAKLTKATDIDYNEEEAKKIEEDEVLYTQFFSIDTENQLVLILNNELLEEINSYDFIKLIY